MVTQYITGDIRFDILTWFSQEDFAFIAEVKYVPDCRELGQTEDEAIEKVKRNLAKILSGKKIEGL